MKLTGEKNSFKVAITVMGRNVTNDRYLNSKFVVMFVASYVLDTSYKQWKCTVVLSSCSCVRLDYGLIKLKGKRKISILI